MPDEFLVFQKKSETPEVPDKLLDTVHNFLQKTKKVEKSNSATLLQLRLKRATLAQMLTEQSKNTESEDYFTPTIKAFDEQIFNLERQHVKKDILNLGALERL